MAWNNQQRGGGGQQPQSYPNSGALFPQQKKQQNSPDMTGNVVISEDVLEYILERAGNGEVKLDLAGWRRQAQSGVNFVSLKINIPYSERQQQDGPAPQYRQQQNYQQRRPVDRGERDQYGGGYQRGPQQNQNRPQQGYAGNAGQGGGRMSTSPRREPEQQMPDFMQDDLNDEIPFG